jgi:hypothetical protein
MRPRGLQGQRCETRIQANRQAVRRTLARSRLAAMRSEQFRRERLQLPQLRRTRHRYCQHVADWTVSTNLISWVPAQHGQFGWPMDGQEAELVRTMTAGDLVVPKFAQAPIWGGSSGQEEYIRGICDVWADDFEAMRADYEAKVAWGAGAVPFVMRVRRHLEDDDRFPSADPWAVVEVELSWLEHPISTSEFPSGQFNANAACTVLGALAHSRLRRTQLPTVDEIVAVMHHTATTVTGWRLRAMIVVL